MFSVGHVVLASKKAHILLVTINKQGKADEHKYMDHWIDDSHFHWQSQNATDPSSKRGQEIIRHAALGIDIHLFVRKQAGRRQSGPLHLPRPRGLRITRG